jgi:hypothetical protein
MRPANLRRSEPLPYAGIDRHKPSDPRIYDWLVLRKVSNSLAVLLLLPLASDWVLSRRAFNRSWMVASVDELLLELLLELLELLLELAELLELLPLSGGGGGGGP